MSSAGVPKATQVSIRVPDKVLAQIDELATLMQRPSSFEDTHPGSFDDTHAVAALVRHQHALGAGVHG